MKATLGDLILLFMLLWLLGSCMHSYMMWVDGELERYEEQINRQVKRVEV
jgi:hypothetical protein